MAKMSRNEAINRLLEEIDEGVLDAKHVVERALEWMGGDVLDFIETEDFFEVEEDDEEEDEDEDAEEDGEGDEYARRVDAEEYAVRNEHDLDAVARDAIASLIGGVAVSLPHDDEGRTWVDESSLARLMSEVSYLWAQGEPHPIKPGWQAWFRAMCRFALSARAFRLNGEIQSASSIEDLMEQLISSDDFDTRFVLMRSSRQQFAEFKRT